MPLAVLLFFLLGLLLIPLAGIQDDEALFAGPLFSAPFLPLTLPILHHHPPLMVFAYTGALKTYVFWPVFKLFAPGPHSLRLPVLLMGAATIAIFYLFAKRIAGGAAALLAVALLATDPTFLFTNTFDFGPVAPQHLLFIGGCWLVARGNLRAGCFAFGLAMWDKAIFIWSLAGLLCAVSIAYWPEVRRVLADKRKIAGAALAFVAGASPLIVFNLRSRNETVRTTAHVSLDHFRQKAYEMELALNGGGLYRFLVAEAWEVENPKPAASLAARGSSAIHNLSGDIRSSLFPYAMSAALLATPLWWKSPLRRAGIFSAVFMLITFAAMAVTRDAGEGLHHSVLVWPMPQLLVGVAAASMGWRWVPVAVGALLAISNLLVVNQYVFQLERFGADGGFTDALYPLSAQLPVAADDHVYLADWGLTQSLTLLDRGRLALMPIGGLLDDPTTDHAAIRRWLADPHGLFVGHTREREVFKGAGQRLEQEAQRDGYRKQLLRTLPDSTGRPVFELFRFGTIN